ncbi:MAG: hypothetical protein AAF696_31995 [Bacteroidota bacterium]
MSSKQNSNNIATPRQGLLQKIQKFIFGAKKKSNSAQLAQIDISEAEESMIIVEKILPGTPIIYIQMGEEIIEAHRDISTYLDGNGLAVGDELEIIEYGVGNRPVIRKKERNKLFVYESNKQQSLPVAKIVSPTWKTGKKMAIKQLP